MFDSFGIHIGPLYLRYYGVILVTGAMLAGYLAALEARRRGLDESHVWDGIIWALVGGILGARLWHVLTPSPSMVAQGITTAFYLTHPLDILAMWRGGLGIPGGVAGGVAGLWLYCRRAKLHFPQWLDIAAPGLPLAQAVGRWGNYVNQELYGQPTSLPWGVYIAPAYRLPGFTSYERFHPLFLYESILNLLVCLVLLYLGRRYAKHLKAGDLFIVYLVLYPSIRFALEFIRLDSALTAGLNINQTVSLVVALAAALTFSLRHRAPTGKPARP